MAHILGDSTLILVHRFGPKVKESCKDWLQQSLSVQPYRSWAMSTVIYGIGSVEATISGQVPVYDAVAPPSVRIGSYRLAPRTLAYKARRTRRHSHGGKGAGDDDDDGPEWDEGGFGGSGSWSSGDNGRGGNDYWGGSSNDEGEWWEDASDATFNFIYEVACWISLTECLQFVLKRLLDVVHHGVEDPANAGAFARCCFVFAQSKSEGAAVLRDVHEMTWARSGTDGN